MVSYFRGSLAVFLNVVATKTYCGFIWKTEISFVQVNRFFLRLFAIMPVLPSSFPHVLRVVETVANGQTCPLDAFNLAGCI